MSLIMMHADSVLAKDLVHIYVNSLALQNDYREMKQGLIDEYNENLMLKEVLVYVKDTCPSLTKPSEKLVAVTPLNKYRKVRFAKATTSSSNTKKQADSHKTQDSNKPMLPSTGMKSSTSAIIAFSESVCNADVKHTSLNENSELIYAKCNQCMFDANHDVCFLEFVNDVNVHSKSKSAKRSKKKQTWKPTGKVFNDVGYKWKPTG
ncbi:hypothetical protein Tco_1088825 [Tanacetum coccineum]